jgi:hypothetical protein
MSCSEFISSVLSLYIIQIVSEHKKKKHEALFQRENRLRHEEKWKRRSSVVHNNVYALKKKKKEKGFIIELPKNRGQNFRRLLL